MLIAKIEGDRFTSFADPPAGFKRLTKTFSNITIPEGYRIYLHTGIYWEEVHRPDVVSIRVEIPEVQDSRGTGERFSIANGRYFSRNATKRDLLKQVRRQLHELITHEMDEWIRYRDELPFDPHA